MNKIPKVVLKTKLVEGGRLPVKGTKGSACYDLYAREITFKTKNLAVVKLGIMTEFPPEFVIEMFSRNSIGGTGWALSNGVGIIVSDYRGEYMAKFQRFQGADEFPYKVGDRVVQIKANVVPDLIIEPTDTLSGSTRTGGYGTTGK